MSDFAQNGIVASLHDFSYRSTSQIEVELVNFSKFNKMELILPCLYSELEGNALPKIIREISKITYLNHIIIVKFTIKTLQKVLWPKHCIP